jgi:integrase
MAKRGRPRNEEPRVLGPTWIESKEAYCVTTIDPRANGGRGRRSDRYFRRLEKAQEWIELVEFRLGRLSGLTIANAIDAYEKHLIECGSTYGEVIRRLRMFFPSPELPLARVTHELAKGYYVAFRNHTLEHIKKDGTPAKDHGRPISVSYHRAALINARSLMSWCMDQGWIAANPFARVKGIGKKDKGKPQPTGDEARKLYAYCYACAVKGDASALGVLMLLLMALRQADLYRRVVRDVDLDATVLRIEKGTAKSEKSEEPREVPEILQPLLRRLVKSRAPTEPLFKTPYTASGFHTRRWLEQALEKFCEAAGVPRIVPHALKGTAGSILAKRGALGNQIADYLSHTDEAVTRGHYLQPGALEQADARRGLAVITGGKRG